MIPENLVKTIASGICRTLCPLLDWDKLSERQQRPYVDAAFVSLSHSGYEAHVVALKAIKTRLHFVGMPQEERSPDGRPRWAKEIALLEHALASTQTLPYEVDIVPSEEPITFASVVSDYWRDEDEETVTDSLEVWSRALSAVGADFEETGEGEIEWSMSLKQAFQLAKTGPWFVGEDYGSNQSKNLANLLECRNQHPSVNDVKRVEELWVDFVNNHQSGVESCNSK